MNEKTESADAVLPAEERAEFEAAMIARKWSPEAFRRSILRGHYFERCTDDAWAGWRAAREAARVDQQTADAILRAWSRGYEAGRHGADQQKTSIEDSAERCSESAQRAADGSAE